VAVLQVLLTTIEVFDGRVLAELDGVYKEVMKKLEEVWSEVSIDRAL